MIWKIPPLVHFYPDDGTIRIPDRDPGEGDLVVCMELSVPLIQPDNHIGRCAECRQAIQFRPDHPAGVRRICVGCALLIASTEGKTPQ